MISLANNTRVIHCIHSAASFRRKPHQHPLTRKLLISDQMYFRLNNRSLLNYNIEKIVTAGSEMTDRIAMRRNEWRDWMGLPPDPEMDELLALENYIPVEMLGQQKKLNGNGGEQDGNKS